MRAWVRALVRTAGKPGRRRRRADVQQHREPDENPALRALRQAAERGDAEAQLRLGRAYDEERRADDSSWPWMFDLVPVWSPDECIREAEKDPRWPPHWLRRAAEQDLPDAQYELGAWYAEFADLGDYGEPEDFAWVRGEARFWLREAADGGHPEAQYRMGLHAEYVDEAAAARWYGEAARRGHARAQLSLGKMYAEGRGVGRDEALARSWWHEAALQGNREAQCLCFAAADQGAAPVRKAEEPGANSWFSLGVLFSEGRSVPQDASAAAFWFRKAAEHGDALAQLELGLLLHRGAGVEEDHGDGIAWLRKAAGQGNAEAQFVLGEIHDRGRGVPADTGAALFWWRQAGWQGHVKAQLELARTYQCVLWDEAKARLWFWKAAGQGHPEAQFALGQMYWRGHGGRRDLVRAYAWFDLSGLQGMERAAGCRRELGDRLRGARLERARRLARDLWVRTQGDDGCEPLWRLPGPLARPPEPRRFQTLLLAELIAVGTVEVRETLLLDASTGVPLDPLQPLPNRFPALWDA